MLKGTIEIDFKTVFNRKPVKIGAQYHFSIPRNMIRNGIIDPDKYYEIWIKEFDETK